MILPFEKAHEALVKNLISPTLDIHIKGLGLLRDLHVYEQAIFLDDIQEKLHNTILQLQHQIYKANEEVIQNIEEQLKYWQGMDMG